MRFIHQAISNNRVNDIVYALLCYKENELLYGTIAKLS